MLRKYIEQILSIYHYLDGVIICDKRGYIEYYTNFRPDINSLTEKEVLGRYILDIYPGLDPERSCILRVLASGNPIFNEFQDVVNAHGEHLRVVNTALPIRLEDGSLVGAVDVSRFLDQEYLRRDITLAAEQGTRARPDHRLYTLDDIYSESRSMFAIKEKILRIAETSSTVMICGENRHRQGNVRPGHPQPGRAAQSPFISQNCAALPASLLEGLLFGTEKGSFTGAETRAGLFELANGGTLFLDEINSMEAAIQPKILKAIEEKQIRRIGSGRTINLDLRVVCALNEDPRMAVEQGRLRQDLFFRLTTVVLAIPPAAGAPRGPSLPGEAIHPRLQPFHEHAGGRRHRRGGSGLPAPRLAGQRPGTQEPHRRRLQHSVRPPDHPGRPSDYLQPRAVDGSPHPDPPPVGASLAQILGDVEKRILREAHGGSREPVRRRAPAPRLQTVPSLQAAEVQVAVILPPPRPPGPVRTG